MINDFPFTILRLSPLMIYLSTYEFNEYALLV